MFLDYLPIKAFEDAKISHGLFWDQVEVNIFWPFESEKIDQIILYETIFRQNTYCATIQICQPLNIIINCGRETDQTYIIIVGNKYQISIAVTGTSRFLRLTFFNVLSYFILMRNEWIGEWNDFVKIHIENLRITYRSINNSSKLEDALILK